MSPCADDARHLPPQETTRDLFYDGRLRLEQPARGHRAGTDGVLLAAATAADFAGSVLDVGSGVGTVGLGLALRIPEARVTLLEKNVFLAELARSNVRASGLNGRAEVIVGDLFAHAGSRFAAEARYDAVVTNPPYLQPAQSRSSPLPLRREAHSFGEGEDLRAWMAACLAMLTPAGRFTLIHRAESLPDILDALGERVGSVTVKPIQSRAGESATRILVRSIKGSRAPFRLAAPLVLHEANGAFTAEADVLHRGLASLVW